MHFCESEFWNNNLTWYTETPKFTECFQTTVLVYTPAAIFLSTSILDIYNCIHSKLRNIPWSAPLITKIVLTSLCILVAVIEISTNFALLAYGSSVYAANIISPLVKMIVYALSLILLLASKHFGQVYSPAQFLFWSTNVLCQALGLVSMAMDDTNEEGINIILLPINIIISTVMFFLNCWADKQPLYADLQEQEEDNPCPKKFASFPSRMLFSWFDELVIKGWKNPLVQSDLWDLNHEDKLATVVEYLEKSIIGKENVSIISVLFTSYWKSFVVLSIFYLTKTLLQLADPQIINLVIQFIELREESWKGYLYMVLFGIVSILTILFDTLYWTTIQLVVNRVYTGLAAIIYKKSLRLSSQSRNNYSSGEIVNLIAVDASKIQEALTFVTLLWVSPVHVVLTVYFTWQVIGPAVLVGKCFNIFIVTQDLLKLHLFRTCNLTSDFTTECN